MERTTRNQVSSYIQLTYAYMALGMLVTGIISVLGATLFANQIANLYQFRYAFLVIVAVQFALIFVVTKLARSANKVIALSGYLAFTALEGLVLAPIILLTPINVTVSAFVSTVGLFGVLSIIGYTTKVDISRWGGILFGMTIALILASIVNLFMGNGMFGIIVSAIAIIIFSAWTAYDTQKIRVDLQQASETDSNSIAIMGAFNLYLDFLNLFINLIQIFGSRN